MPIAELKAKIGVNCDQNVLFWRTDSNSRWKRKSRQKIGKISYFANMHSTLAGKHEYEYVGRFKTKGIFF